MAPIIQQLISTQSDVRFIFENYPIFGEKSALAAQTGLAVWKAGGEKAFQPYHEAMFSNNTEKQGLDIKQAIKKAGVTLSVEETPNSEIAATSNEAREIGIEGTPAFIVMNTEKPTLEYTTMFFGAVSEKTLLAAIEKAKRGK